MSNPGMQSNKLSPRIVTSPDFPKSPSVERLEHGVALSFAQERARLHGMHLDECMRVIPSLKEIHLKLQENVTRFGKLVSAETMTSPDADGEICNSPVLPAFHAVSRPSTPSPQIFPLSQDKRKQLQTVYSQLSQLNEQLSRSVLVLEEIREKDRTRRLSSDYLTRAMSSVISDQSAASTPTPNTTTPHFTSIGLPPKTTATPPTVGSTNSWSDSEYPPPLDLVPNLPPVLESPSEGNGANNSATALTNVAAALPPVPVPPQFTVPTHTLSSATTSTMVVTTNTSTVATTQPTPNPTEIAELMKTIQQLLDKVREGQSERQFDRSHIHAEERAAIEKQYKDRIKRYKSRLAQYEHLLISHGIRRADHHHQQSRSASMSPRTATRSPHHASSQLPSSATSRARMYIPAAFLRVMDVALEFLCLNDYLMSVVRFMVSLVVWPKNMMYSWFTTTKPGCGEAAIEGSSSRDRASSFGEFV